MPSPLGMTLMSMAQPSASCGHHQARLRGLGPPQSTAALCWLQAVLLAHGSHTHRLLPLPSPQAT